ncbi:MAG: twin-arginine translocase TatA/TatE family subunit [Nitrospirota bacterium]|nr:twin-arginine translocase TatA/TatE family subunit [Nitrospirota bacterium]
MMGGLGMAEMVVILVIVLILFGPSKLPALGEGLGKAIGGFKKGLRDEHEGTKEAKKVSA